MHAIPTLYSFRRCPYAIRARMALADAQVTVELREVLLKAKPQAMLEASAKGTVPVLVLPDDSVIDESLEVMRWALAQSDPHAWSEGASSAEALKLIERNDGEFKYWLDRYKYAVRYPEHPMAWYREQAEAFLQELNATLEPQPWLAGPAMGFVDVAIFPFVRQFAGVEPQWFAESPYESLRAWLERLLREPLFEAVMKKYPLWEPGAAPLLVDWSPDPETRAAP